MITREPTAVTVRVADQLIVFRGSGYSFPYCTATHRSAVQRCHFSLSRSLDYHGSQDVCVAGVAGSVHAIRTGAGDDACWLKQRCPEHLEGGQAILAPEWTPFDPVRDADLLCIVEPLWMPRGIADPPRRYLNPGDAPAATPADEAGQIIAQAFAARVEPTVTTALYRWFDEKDRLLYVGITDDLLWRVQSHILESSWMDYAARSTIVRYPTRRDASDAETAAIKAEQPLFNKVHNRTPDAQLRLVEFLVEHGHIGPYLTPAN